MLCKPKRLASLLLVLVLLLCGCGSNMPFNGDVTFHELSVTVPSKFVRDSTQSNEDLWVFEHGGYKEYILLSRSGAADPESYCQTMLQRGAESALTTFRGKDAVQSAYTKDGEYCQELLLIHNGAAYAIALRGGTQEEFRALLDTVKVVEP